ncbi:conserved hypothetical protein [Shigella boydii CDC 3083-94]|uniref:ATP-dependent helicase n=2 Tax=Shigella boydii TaxID=621 RepID=B2U2F6_SHIB3|nr:MULTISPECIES: hypothetical protein [Shigella]ACD08773.1 conserved hypothetical protein [Shigella boydii CDC 3083-94]ODG67487.1 hypothetical protein BFF42_12965 [Shigella sp. FC1661]ODJ22297.1 hypothetical protein BFR11_12730 [Shigella sp. FC2383]SPZ86267.1 putative ATP-dependent helicase Lhr [Shigella boydii]
MLTRVKYPTLASICLTESHTALQKEELLAPEVFHALTTALRREPRLRFTLTEVNDLPVRQTPMFTLLREAGFSSSPQGLDWG